MKFRSLLITFLATLTILSSQAAIKEVSYSKKVISAEKHEVVDIKFKALGKIANPFDVNVSATFTSPSGKQQVVPAFYNGANDWVVRFTASEVGEWSYITGGDLKSIKGKAGKINLIDKSYSNRLGAVMIDPKNPRHLIWENGSPYFLLGFECDFLFTLDYHNDSTERLDSFVDNVAKNGFNHFVMNVYANDVVWKKDEKLIADYDMGGDEKIFPFLGSNSKPDHSSLNVEFFKKLDRTMEALNDRNIISHLMIYVWNKNVAWPEPGSAEDDRYFDYVVKRYQAFTNLVWDISKEALYYGTVDDNYVTRRIERLRELDSYERMVTVHDIGYCNRNSDKVDMVSQQDWKLYVNAEMKNSYDKHKTKVVLNVEHGGYEESDYDVFCGNYINAEYCLRRNYESLFAGVYTTYYWQGCSWNVIIDDFETSTRVSYRPKMHYFKHMSDFFTEYPYHTLKPSPRDNNSGFCLTNGDDLYLMYMPKESYKTSLWRVMKESKRVSLQWFNTHTGEYTDVKMCEKMDNSSDNSHPFFMEHDAILIIKVLEKK